MLKTGMKPVDIAKAVGCTPALVYNVKARVAGGSGGGAKKRGPGRPPKTAAKPSAPRPASSISSAGDGLASIVAAVKASEQERSQMRAALEKIQAVINDALS